MDQITPTGTLYLIPTPLGEDEDPLRVLPAATVDAVVGLEHFVAERARSARSVLGRLPMRRPLQQLSITELNQNTPPADLPGLLAPLLAGQDLGLLSEAGCPAVADPGAALVALAHQRGLRVVPLVGPSSLLLALMASGMNGQAFGFVGYPPVDATARVQRLRELERRSALNGETVLMIETPYRNQALFSAMLECLAEHTVVGVAARLSLAGETIRAQTVARWRAAPPVLEKTPTVFSLQAMAAVRGDGGRSGGARSGGARSGGEQSGGGAPAAGQRERQATGRGPAPQRGGPAQQRGGPNRKDRSGGR